ncbi:MAG: asparagine synthase (glutamine-hydrolyzing) [Gemmatimonadota bacterium]
MCGICGVVGGDPTLELPRLRRMAHAIAHRGPDDEGFHAGTGAVLGNRRLEVIDLEGGHQPLANEDGTLWITYNGEIYNFRELRRELVEARHRFRTATDTEVILHLYEDLGSRCVERLRGMFAFAVWDGRRGSLFAARDRFGQKPLYYAMDRGRFLFASEIKGLLAHPDLTAEPEPAATDYYLGLRFIPPPLTMLRGIHKLPAGHWLIWKGGELTVRRYWELSFREGRSRGDGEWVAELGERVREAVRVHLVSDVPVGAFLSGGIDSSVIVAAMARELDGSVPTFSIGSDAPGYDERPHARLVAAHCGTSHHERQVTARQLAGIPRLVRTLDEPSDPIAGCIYEASRLAAEHVKVVLGGDGGDEIFAGFDRYAAFEWADWYTRLPRLFREKIVRPAVERLSDSFAYKGLVQRARWLVAVGEEQGARRYARMTTVFRFGAREKEWLYGPALREALVGHDAEEAMARPFEEARADSLLHRMLAADVVTRLPEHTLMLSDRLGMAHGLETRAPLLDHELAEFCASMPARLKIRRGVTKYAMRRAARRFLPPKILRRAKQGFMFPVAHWLAAEAVPGLCRALRDGPLVKEGWVRPAAVDRLFREHAARRADHHVRIWMLLSLDAWHRIYLGGESAEEPGAPQPLTLPRSSGSPASPSRSAPS